MEERETSCTITSAPTRCTSSQSWCVRGKVCPGAVTYKLFPFPSLPPAQIVAFILHFFLTFLTIWSAVILRQRQLLHATYKLFMISVFIHVREIDNLTSDSDGRAKRISNACLSLLSFKSVGVFLLTFHFTVYAIDGRGAESLKLNGRMCEACAEIIM